MKATDLYNHLENDFISDGLSDEWSQFVDNIKDYISENFLKRSMGLVCDFADQITKVYTAVFPSDKVMLKILESDIQDAMLFVHHPAIWDIRKEPEIFQQMNRDLLHQFKERRVSIYNLHVPLDNFGKYSTGVSLANELGVVPEKAFSNYFGALSGVIGKTQIESVKDLKNKFMDIVGHDVSLYQYGDEKIIDGKVAIIAGGGNEVDALTEVYQAGANVFINGVTLKNEYSFKAHEYAKEHRINILGGTHYSTEKFACISMIDYFSKLGIQAEFIDDEPVMEDM